MGFLDRHAKNPDATVNNHHIQHEEPKKKTSRSLLTTRLQILSTAVHIDRIFKPLSPASIFYSILSIITSFILQPTNSLMDDSSYYSLSSPESQYVPVSNLHKKLCPCCQDGNSEPKKYKTTSSIYLNRLPIPPSRIMLSLLSKKLYKRFKRFKGSIYMHLLQPSPTLSLLQSTSIGIYPNVILIEDWAYLLSFNSIYVKIGEIYFPNEMLVTCGGEFNAIFTCFFDILRKSENNFISFIRYFMLRIRNIPHFCFSPDDVLEELDVSIFEMPSTATKVDHAAGEEPAICSSSLGEANGTPLRHGSMFPLSSSPAFTLRSSDLGKELVNKRFVFVTSLAPITIGEMICKYAVQFDFTFITTLIEEIRIGIDRISLISPSKGQSMVLSTNYSLCKFPVLDNLLFEVSMFSILCRLLTLIKEISPLVPGLIKTCIVQLLRLTRIESSLPQKTSSSIHADKSQNMDHSSCENGLAAPSKKQEESDAIGQKKDQKSTQNGYLDASHCHPPTGTDFSSTASFNHANMNHSYSGDSVFVFDGSLFVLKSPHLVARLICCLLSSILSHLSVVNIRQEMYSYFIGRLLNSPSTTSSSTISGNGFYGAGSLLPLNAITSTKQLFAAMLASNATSSGYKNNVVGTHGKHFGKLGKLSALPNVFLHLKLSRERLFHKGNGDIEKSRRYSAFFPGNDKRSQDTHK